MRRSARKFDEFFHAATVEIREFASALQEQGGTILGNVEGVDVTVEHVASLEESELLKIDYGTALGQVSPGFQAETGVGAAAADAPPDVFGPGSHSRSGQDASHARAEACAPTPARIGRTRHALGSHAPANLDGGN